MHIKWKSLWGFYNERNVFEKLLTNTEKLLNWLFYESVTIASKSLYFFYLSQNLHLMLHLVSIEMCITLNQTDTWKMYLFFLLLWFYHRKLHHILLMLQIIPIFVNWVKSSNNCDWSLLSYQNVSQEPYEIPK